ncbi:MULTISPECIES: AMP-binding protein [unclassified Frankia]|uniref:AMP-binding protein n=1 Tax=unclassified Frankia TaxID=2632575 RepID=UPI00202449BC
MTGSTTTGSAATSSAATSSAATSSAARTGSAAARRREALEARYPRWVPRTTAQLLDLLAAERPHRPLVLGDARSYSYGDIADWSGRLAAGLMALGVRPGDHVAVDMANLPEVVALKFAVARVGAVSVSINFRLRHEELSYVLRQSDSVVLITMDRFRELDYLDALDRIAPGWETEAGGSSLPRLRHVFVLGTDGGPARGRPLGELVELGRGISDEEVRSRTAAADPDAVSDLLYTSGTTGAAKGVMLQHDAVLRTAYASAYTRAFGDGRRILFALPIYHVFGYVEGLVAALFVGGAICPHATFDAQQTLRDIARHRIDELICVPAMTSLVLDAARAGEHDLSSLRTMFSSGAAHCAGMWADMLEVLGVEEIFTAYGQTETTASTTCTRPGDPLDRLANTNGTTKPAGVAGAAELGGTLAVYRTVHSETGADIPAGEVGELVVRGPIVTRGYYDKPAETTALFTPDGWMRTGDLGRIDEQGYLILTGRKKESYRCGGELVLPGEVERVLTDHPGVAAAHVVGIPHARMGEVGCAWIVPGPGRPAPDELVAYCANRLARFKVPDVVLFIEEDEIPVTATGRVQKFMLAERAVALLAQRARTEQGTPDAQTGPGTQDARTGPGTQAVSGAARPASVGSA